MLLFSKLRRVVAVGLLAAMVGGGVTVSAGLLQGRPEEPPAKAPAQRAAADTRLEELQRDQLAALKELVQIEERLYQSGRGAFTDLQRAAAQLLKAELRACKSGKERVEVLQRSVEHAKAVEQYADRLHQAGRATMAAVLAAKADRLEVEIMLEQEKAKPAPPPK